MYFIAMAQPFDAIELEHAAALMDVSQPKARAWLEALSRMRDGFICVGRENDEVLALAAGIIEKRGEGATLLLQELCVASPRRASGLGEEMLAFTLRKAATRGATGAIASKSRAGRGGAFLRQHGFIDTSGTLCRPISLSG